MFLSKEEIQRLTGKKRSSAQIAWLKEHGCRVKAGARWSKLDPDMEDEIEVIEREQRVYVVPAGNLLKIGIARDVPTRWRALRTGCPSIEAVLYSTALLSNASQIERLVHRELSRFRKSGEWFDCTRTLAVQTVQRFEVERGVRLALESRG